MSTLLDTISNLSRDDWFFLGFLAAAAIVAIHAAFIELGARPKGKRYTVEI